MDKAAWGGLGFLGRAGFKSSLADHPKKGTVEPSPAPNLRALVRG